MVFPFLNHYLGLPLIWSPFLFGLFWWSCIFAFQRKQKKRETRMKQAQIPKYLPFKITNSRRPHRNTLADATSFLSRSVFKMNPTYTNTFPFSLNMMMQSSLLLISHILLSRATKRKLIRFQKVSIDGG